jgi:2'-5' RNA ligase
VKSGIIILSELRGPLRERILEIQRRFDPKLARAVPPHVTITGSSGIGPIATRTTNAELRRALGPIAESTAPMTLPLGRPMRFMQTNIVVLPLDPHGRLRQLHDAIATSGLLYEQPRFTFTPHVTLTFFRELDPDDVRELLALRVDEPVTLDHISAHRTTDGVTSTKLLELPLSGLLSARK